MEADLITNGTMSPGPIPEVTSIGEPADYPKMANDVFFGGVYRPHDCVARQTVAVIVPYM